MEYQKELERHGANVVVPYDLSELRYYNKITAYFYESDFKITLSSMIKVSSFGNIEACRHVSKGHLYDVLDTLAKTYGAYSVTYEYFDNYED